MQATPFVGLSSLKLGMSQEDVLRVFGQPDSFESNVAPGDKIFLFAGPKIELTFTEEFGWRLSRITIYSEAVTIGGVKLVGAEIKSLLLTAKEVGIGELKEDGDFDEFGRCFTCEDSGLMLWVKDGEVINFTLFPRFSEDGNTALFPE